LTGNLRSEIQRVGEDVVFGANVSITAASIDIADKVIFKDNIAIDCKGAVKIGHHSIIGANSRVRCNNLTIGQWLYACEGLEIGAGGCNNKESDVHIGDYVGIFERVLINPNSPVVIGDNCGIGREVQIWTHGAWLDPLSGFPSDFGPVLIGNNVWLPARTIMLPNSSIGDDCVIGINSIINKRIPSGSFAAGCPVKIIRENAFPRQLSDEEIVAIVNRILTDWRCLIEFKKPGLIYSLEVLNSGLVRLTTEGDETIFDCRMKKIAGAKTEYSEDLRDYLRRRGIKIFTDDYFKSI